MWYSFYINTIFEIYLHEVTALMVAFHPWKQKCANQPRFMQLLSRAKLSQLKRKKRHLLGFNYTNSNFDLYLIYCKRNATTAYKGGKKLLRLYKKKRPIILARLYSCFLLKSFRSLRNGLSKWDGIFLCLVFLFQGLVHAVRLAETGV